MSKLIPLSQGQFATVDDEDFEFLSQWKWLARKCRNTFYAARYLPRDRGRRAIHMHRVINKTPDDMITDHINGNGLDNRKSNLRNATIAQNAWNMRPRKDCGQRGIYYDKARSKWVADIQCERRRIRLGRFGTKDEALAAYQTAAKQLFGCFNRSGS